MELIDIILHLSAGGLTPVLLLAVYILWQRLIYVTDMLITLRKDFERHKVKSNIDRERIMHKIDES